jgi:hypothetical protein
MLAEDSIYSSYRKLHQAYVQMLKQGLRMVKVVHPVSIAL